ncbi:MAG: PASTA domain-containing protein [Bacteroidetes bacterium]|nr:PASTA domain-containing protein [Bacteroidota bacterium]
MKKIIKNISLVVLLFMISIFILDSLIMPNYVQNKKIVEVPNVVGNKFDDAKIYLENLGFKVHKLSGGINLKYSSNSVSSQNPIAFRKVKEGRDIYLTIVSLSNEVRVPHLIGKTMREATFLLESIGLQQVEILYDFDPSIPEGAVKSQTIAVGIFVPVNTTINFTVNSLPPNTFQEVDTLE